MATQARIAPNPSSFVLGKIQFEKKQNKAQPRLPPNTTIQRRPLTHAPVASPYAGSSVQKAVYVSRSTPLMAAVKRVKKLLAHIEKRAMQGVDVTKNRGGGLEELAKASEKLGKGVEAVVVKASGRAMEKALKVGMWFEKKEAELACRVEVRSGSVRVVDDLVEVEVEEDEEGEGDGEKGVDEEEDGEGVDASESVEELTEQEITMSGNDIEGFNVEETLPQKETVEEKVEQEITMSGNDIEGATAEETVPQEGRAEQKVEQQGKKRSRGKRGKRKRAMYDKDDMPEARIRWINTVEVAISWKG